MLKFSKKSSNKNSGTYFEEINIGLWNFDVIEGGILADSYPEANKIVKADVISEKIKDIILIQSKSNSYKNDWSLSPIKIEDSHFYLYGFLLPSGALFLSSYLLNLVTGLFIIKVR